MSRFAQAAHWRISLINASARLSNMNPACLLTPRVLPLTDKTPDERAKTLENFSAIAEIHTQYAQGGQSSVPEDLEVDYHFTCFVVAPEAEVRARAAAAPTSSEPDPGAAAPAGAGDAVTESTDNTSGMRLIELDGTRGGPIDRGECKDLLRVRPIRYKLCCILPKLKTGFVFRVLGRRKLYQNEAPLENIKCGIQHVGVRSTT